MCVQGGKNVKNVNNKNFRYALTAAIRERPGEHVRMRARACVRGLDSHHPGWCKLILDLKIVTARSFGRRLLVFVHMQGHIAR